MRIKIVQHKYGNGKEVVIQHEFAPTEIGAMAITFATHFGIIAAKEDGEDTAGRSKIALQSVDDVVQRSCDLAEKLWNEMMKRKWLIAIPEVPDEADTKTEPPAEPTK